jgi:hypothetical protein
MRLITQTNKLNPMHPDYDADLSGLAGAIVTGIGVLPECDGTNTSYEVPNQFLSLPVADMLHAKGVEIKGFPLFIEIDDKEDDNAFGIEDEESNVLTWEEWKLSNHTFYEADGRIFIGTNAHTNEDIDFADLQIVRESLVTAQELPIV